MKENIPSVFAIWLRRGKFIDQAKGIEGFKPDSTITNLSEIVEIIKRN